MFQFPSKMKEVFVDPQVQAEFERNGYVVVEYYNSEEIDYLLNLYRNLHPKDEQGFFPSTFSKDKSYRKIADEEIRNVGERSIKRLFKDIKVVCGSFIVKTSEESSAMDVHQDMTLVDESRYTGINIWCPLVDLTETNGVLYLLPGSHRFYPTYRGASIPNIYENVYDDIKKYMVPEYVKAGQAIVLDQSIIHYSPANLSGEIRPVANTYFTYKDATFRTAYFDKKYPGKVELFEQDNNFITDFEQFGDNIFDRPKIGKSLGYFDWDFPKLTTEMLEEKYGKGRKKSFIRKLLSVFE